MNYNTQQICRLITIVFSLIAAILSGWCALSYQHPIMYGIVCLVMVVIFLYSMFTYLESERPDDE